MTMINAQWLSLSQGIDIPNLNIFIPWLISKDELFEIIPYSYFVMSQGSEWPTLRFSLLGFAAAWGFNFVSHSESKLTELQFRNDKLHSPKRTYRRSQSKLQNSLGRPNFVDHGFLGQQIWNIDNIWVDNHLAKGLRLRSMQTVPVHFLSVRCGA